MKKVKERSMVYVAGSAVFMLLAYIMMRNGIYIPALFCLLFGMLCASDCFICGREYEIERRREIMEQTYKWEELEPGLKLDHCKNCNGQEFYVVAGRLVCMYCGEVMKHE